MNDRKRAPKITTEFILITPKLAEEMLATSQYNRPVRHAWIDRLVKMIQTGEIKTTHQGIAFDELGRLIDGHHRLRAIVEAGIPVMMMVTRGWPAEVYPCIDGGIVRSLADKLRFTSKPDLDKIIASMVRCRVIVTMRSHSLPTVSDHEAEFLEHADLYIAVANIWKRKTYRVTRSEIGAALVSYAIANKEHAMAFGEQLVTGAGLEQGDPALTLRETLIAGKAIQRSTGQQELYFKAIAAMRAHNEGRKIGFVMTAKEDFQGVQYRKIAHARRMIAQKGLKTRFARRKQDRA